MTSTLYVCVTCERKFEIEVITAEEATARRINTRPVTCPHCDSGNVFSPK